MIDAEAGSAVARRPISWPGARDYRAGLSLIILLSFSLCLAVLLTGKQIFQANWGIIDDFEIFTFLGPDLHLPIGEVWHTLLTKTEVGTLQGRFRPGFYTFRLLEAAIWGPNVHLWYFSNTMGFAIFLGSCAWMMSRFVGTLLSAILTAYLAVLPLWAGIWSRLGTSEINGAASVGVILFAAYGVFFGERATSRNVSAAALTAGTLMLIGAKETFLPLAGGSLAILAIASFRRRIPAWPSILWGLVIVAGVGAIALVAARQVSAAGGDFYAKPIALWTTIEPAIKGLWSAARSTVLIYAVPILACWRLAAAGSIPSRKFAEATLVVLLIYAFLLLMYASQCALYRAQFPQWNRYDFPAMLIVPASFCVMACYSLHMAQCMRAIVVAKVLAVLIGVAGASAAIVKYRADPLPAAVQANIDVTNAFFRELQRAIDSAKQSPEQPIILEAYGVNAYEGVYSLRTYLQTFGVKNSISVRVHSSGNSDSPLNSRLESALLSMEQDGAPGLVPLERISDSKGCISIGIEGAPDSRCLGFEVKAEIGS